MKYVVKDIYDQYQVCEGTYPPPGVICEAPAEATTGCGDLIDVVDGVASINQERKIVKDAVNAQRAIDWKWFKMRSMRDSLLAQSDWTVLTASPLSTDKKNEWKAYRQELRDLPENTADIDNVQWPEKPE